MMRIFICLHCGRTRIISRLLRAECFECGHKMVLCRIPYSQWVGMSREQRNEVMEEYKDGD